MATRKTAIRGAKKPKLTKAATPVRLPKAVGKAKAKTAAKRQGSRRS